MRFTIEDATKILGLKVYDTALPQDWVDVQQRNWHDSPVGKVVWCYDRMKTLGEPIALTPEWFRRVGN